MDKGKLRVALALIGILSFAFFVSTYFGHDVAINKDGKTFHERFIWIGTDPYYHHRVIEYIQTSNGALLYKEPLNNYPVGSVNPRPPLFDYTQAILGMALAPFFHSEGEINSLQMATGYVMAFFPCIFGALCIIPVYFVAMILFNRRIGLLAAFLFATTPAWITGIVIGLADHDSFYMFFMISGFAFFVKALKMYKDDKQTIKDSVLNNRPAIIYGALAGVMFSLVALSWEGFLIPTGTITIFAGLEMIIDKMRNKDPSGAWLITSAAHILTLLLMLPYYYSHQKLYYIHMQSFFLFVVFAAGLIFVPTKKLPGILVIPSGAAAGIATLGILNLSRTHLPGTVLASIGNSIFGQIYYLQKSKVYTTVAEASSVSDISLLAASYGFVTFFLSLGCILWLIWNLWKNWRKDYAFLLVWGVVSLYLGIASHRFLSTAAPAMAVLGAFVLYGLIQKMRFADASKKFSSLKANGFWFALKKSTGARQILGALFIAFLIVLPNVWFAVDAGIPGEVENEWIRNELGARNLSWTRENITRTFAGHFFGAFGQGYYNGWIPAMTWLSRQDNDVRVEERPAQISWWDYGFYCVDIGDHPTVADPFQEGIPPAGAFLLAQNESEQIAVLITRILERNVDDNKGFSEDIRTLMQGYGLNKTLNETNKTQIEYLEDVMLNPQKTEYRDEVLNHPEMYGDYVDEKEELEIEKMMYYRAVGWGGLTPQNTKYAIMRVKLATWLDEHHIVKLYHDICNVTGYQIRYFGVEMRDITDIFVVFVKLTDRKPDDYVSTVVKDINGNMHTIDEIRELAEKKDNWVRLAYTDGKVIEYHTMWEEQNNRNYQYIKPGFRLNYETRYSQKFYNSSVYRAFFGYSGYELFGQDMGIPGYQGQLYQYGYPPMPCWMAKHFRIVYLDPQNSTVRIAKFYEGANLSGEIKDDDGNPITNAIVTVFDDFGIPHDYTTTNETGYYSLTAPFSLPGKNITVAVTTGSLNPLYGTGSDELTKIELPISYEQAMNFEKIVNNITVRYGNATGVVFKDLNGDGKYNATEDVPVADVSVKLGEMETLTNETGMYMFEKLLPGRYTIDASSFPYRSESRTVTVRENETATEDIVLKILPSLNGTVFIEDDPVAGASVTLDNFSTTTDQNGYYEFRYIEPGTYTINASYPGYSGSSSVTLVLGENETVNISLAIKPVDVSGFVGYDYNQDGVLSDFERMKDVTVKFNALGGAAVNKTATTSRLEADYGAYSVKLMPGDYMVVVNHTVNNILFTYQQSFSVPVASDPVQYNISLDANKTFQNVVNLSGYVMATLENKTEYLRNITFSIGNRTVPTDSTGRYSISVETGNYTVVVDVQYPYENTAYHLTYSGYLVAHIDEITKYLPITAKTD